MKLTPIISRKYIETIQSILICADIDTSPFCATEKFAGIYSETGAILGTIRPRNLGIHVLRCELFYNKFSYGRIDYVLPSTLGRNRAVC